MRSRNGGECSWLGETWMREVELVTPSDTVTTTLRVVSSMGSGVVLVVVVVLVVLVVVDVVEDSALAVAFAAVPLVPAAVVIGAVVVDVVVVCVFVGLSEATRTTDRCV